MRKRTIGGLFAATLTFSAIVAVSSCNEEDEYYNDSNYTLAKKHMTRATEGATRPSQSVKYKGGNVDKEVGFEGVRLHFNVSWDGKQGTGNSNAGIISVTYNGYDQVSGYVYYYDDLDILRKVYNVEIVGIKTEGTPMIIGDILLVYIPVRYKEKQVMKDNNGEVMTDKNGLIKYCMGPEKEKTAIVEVDLSSYRID